MGNEIQGLKRSFTTTTSKPMTDTQAHAQEIKHSKQHEDLKAEETGMRQQLPSQQEQASSAIEEAAKLQQPQTETTRRNSSPRKEVSGSRDSVQPPSVQPNAALTLAKEASARACAPHKHAAEPGVRVCDSNDDQVKSLAVPSEAKASNLLDQATNSDRTADPQLAESKAAKKKKRGKNQSARAKARKQRQAEEEERVLCEQSKEEEEQIRSLQSQEEEERALSLHKEEEQVLTLQPKEEERVLSLQSKKQEAEGQQQHKQDELDLHESEDDVNSVSYHLTRSVPGVSMDIDWLHAVPSILDIKAPQPSSVQDRHDKQVGFAAENTVQGVTEPDAGSQNLSNPNGALQHAEQEQAAAKDNQHACTTHQSGKEQPKTRKPPALPLALPPSRAPTAPTAQVPAQSRSHAITAKARPQASLVNLASCSDVRFASSRSDSGSSDSSCSGCGRRSQGTDGSSSNGDKLSPVKIASSKVNSRKPGSNGPGNSELVSVKDAGSKISNDKKDTSSVSHIEPNAAGFASSKISSNKTSASSVRSSDLNAVKAAGSSDKTGKSSSSGSNAMPARLAGSKTSSNSKTASSSIGGSEPNAAKAADSKISSSKATNSSVSGCETAVPKSADSKPSSYKTGKGSVNGNDSFTAKLAGSNISRDRTASSDVNGSEIMPAKAADNKAISNSTGKSSTPGTESLTAKADGSKISRDRVGNRTIVGSETVAAKAAGSIDSSNNTARGNVSSTGPVTAKAAGSIDSSNNTARGNVSSTEPVTAKAAGSNVSSNKRGNTGVSSTDITAAKAAGSKLSSNNTGRSSFPGTASVTARTTGSSITGSDRTGNSYASGKAESAVNAAKDSTGNGRTVSTGAANSGYTAAKAAGSNPTSRVLACQAQGNPVFDYGRAVNTPEAGSNNASGRGMQLQFGSFAPFKIADSPSTNGSNTFCLVTGSSNAFGSNTSSLEPASSGPSSISQPAKASSSNSALSRTSLPAKASSSNSGPNITKQPPKASSSNCGPTSTIQPMKASSINSNPVGNSLPAKVISSNSGPSSSSQPPEATGSSSSGMSNAGRHLPRPSAPGARTDPRIVGERKLPPTDLAMAASKRKHSNNASGESPAGAEPSPQATGQTSSTVSPDAVAETSTRTAGLITDSKTDIIAKSATVSRQRSRTLQEIINNAMQEFMLSHDSAEFVQDMQALLGSTSEAELLHGILKAACAKLGTLCWAKQQAAPAHFNLRTRRQLLLFMKDGLKRSYRSAGIINAAELDLPHQKGSDSRLTSLCFHRASPGYVMMQQKGWSEGQGLGAHLQGKLEPFLPASQPFDWESRTQGLGWDRYPAFLPGQQTADQLKVRCLPIMMSIVVHRPFWDSYPGFFPGEQAADQLKELTVTLCSGQGSVVTGGAVQQGLEAFLITSLPADNPEAPDLGLKSLCWVGSLMGALAFTDVIIEDDAHSLIASAVSAQSRCLPADAWQQATAALEVGLSDLQEAARAKEVQEQLAQETAADQLAEMQQPKAPRKTKTRVEGSQGKTLRVKTVQYGKDKTPAQMNNGQVPWE